MREVSALVLALLLSSITCWAQPFSVRQEGTRIYLLDGPHRLLISDDSRALMLPGDVVLTPQVQSPLPNSAVYTVTRHGKPDGLLDLNALLMTWLVDDARWGGHEKANSLRYFASTSGGGLDVSITDVVPGDAAPCALVSIRLHGPSFRPLAEQLLVRMTATPEITLTPLRRLALMPTGPLDMHVPCRLYRADQHVLLYQRDESTPDTPSACQAEVLLLDETGAVLRRLTALPNYVYPAGFLAARWLVLGPALNTELLSDTVQPVQVYDLLANTLTSLPGPWTRRCTVHVPATGEHIVISQPCPEDEGAQPGNRPTRYRSYLVHLPKGTRVPLQTDDLPGSVYYWRNLLVDHRGNGVSLFDAATGTLVQRLEIREDEPRQPE